jgi:putative flippase GtrA
MGALPLLSDADARTLLARFMRLASPALRRILVYGCVGVAISVFYSFTAISFVWLLYPIRPVIASIVAFVFTVPVAYLAHAKLSFSDRSYDKFQPSRFAMLTTLSFVVSIGGMYWITEIARGSYLLGIAWNWLIIPVVNFVSNILWVFRTGRNTERIN